MTPGDLDGAMTPGDLDGAMTPGDLDVTVVIPAHNAGSRLSGNVAEAVAVLDGTGRSFEVIVVDDGSTDGSVAAVKTLAERDARVEVIGLGANHGKGFAVRTGLLAGRGRWRGFIDADGDLPFALLATFVMRAAAGTVDIVLGTKRDQASSTDVTLLRRSASRAYEVLVRALFGLGVRDTQTGIKLMSAEVVDSVVRRLVEDRFAFDVELLVTAREMGLTRWALVPVRTAARLSTTMSPSRVLQLVRDTLAVRHRHRGRARASVTRPGVTSRSYHLPRGGPSAKRS